MSFLDDIFIVFMFLLPYAICIAAYIWVGRKALKVPNRFSRYTALTVVAAGLGYTLYKFIRGIGNIMREENFQYIILIVMVAVLALASIIMAFGEPEEKVESRQ